MFLEAEGRPEFRQSLPWDTQKRLPAVVAAQIAGMSFFSLDQHACCTLDLALLSEDAPSETVSSQETHLDDLPHIQVTFYDADCVPDFVILACRYDWAMLHAYKVGDVVRVLYGNEESYSGKIVATSGSRRRSPWQCYTIEW